MARYDRIYLSNFRNAFPEKGHARISSSSSYICHLKLKLFLPLVQWCIIGLSIEKFVLIQPDLTALPLWACFNVASSVKFKLFFVAPTHSSSVWRSFSLLVHPVSWAFFFSSVFGKHFTHVGVHGFSYRIAFRTLLTAILSISRPLLPASRQRKMPPHLQGVRKETLCLAQDGLACVKRFPSLRRRHGFYGYFTHVFLPPYAQRCKLFDSLHWKRKNSPTCSNYSKIVQDFQLIYITNNF